jgi:hypothetical protein
MPDVYRDSYADALAGQQEWREFLIRPSEIDKILYYSIIKSYTASSIKCVP